MSGRRAAAGNSQFTSVPAAAGWEPAVGSSEFPRDARGMTLIEVAIVLVVVFAVIGALAPTVSAVVRHAEVAAATTAMNEIRDALLVALTDMNFSDFTVDGDKNSTKAGMLVGDGDTPRTVSVAGSASWQAAVNNTTGLTDFLERHLVTNNPRGNAANAYDPPGGPGWRGAYLTGPIDPDPWGNRYAVNVEYLGGGAGGNNDVVVYSAGPDEEIDSAYGANPLVAGDDDVTVLVES